MLFTPGYRSHRRISPNNSRHMFPDQLLARSGRYAQCVANSTIAAASNSHEIIKPANMRQPRAFDIPPRSGSSILLGSTNGLIGRSTGAFDVRDDPSGPVPVVEEAISPFGLAIDAGRAFLCLGLGGRCFFIAYSCSLTIAARRPNRRVVGRRKLG